ncbi:hypothetical protein BT96DRAFT_973553, partial [Gymnopus androsaceus JB14]
MMTLAQSNSEYSAGSMFSHASDFIINGSIFNVISTDKRREIQKWLNAPNCSENFTTALNSKTEGTCEWILHHEGYIQWKNNPDILWIQGKVGCGKTFLVTTIISDLTNAFPGAVWYHYFDSRDNSRVKSRYNGFLLSLLQQMGSDQGQIHPVLLDLHGKHKKGFLDEHPSNKALEKTLRTIIENLNWGYIVIDALDECSEVDDVLELLSSYKQKLNILITSRHPASSCETGFNIFLDNFGADLSHDIELYVQKNLAKRKFPTWLYNEIIVELQQGSHEQFLWVACQIKVLEQCHSPKTIKASLKALPKTLEDSYRKALETINQGNHVEDACQLLRWLIYAVEPLSVAQFQEMAAVDTNTSLFDPERRLLDFENHFWEILDSRLVGINENKIVHLAHSSVKDFLTMELAQSQYSSLININEQLSQEKILHTCLVYLFQFNTLEAYRFEEDFPLAVYAAKYWPYHMKRIESWEQNPVNELAEMILTDSTPEYFNWIRICRPDQAWQGVDPGLDTDKIPPSLYYAAYLG